MYKTYKGEILCKLEKEFLKLYTLHSHNTQLPSNNIDLSQISTFYGKQTLAYKGVKLCFEIDPEVNRMEWFSFNPVRNNFSVKNVSFSD